MPPEPATPGARQAGEGAVPVLYIETDIQTDVDDVGALALAMTLERQGRIRIAGVGVNTTSRWGARAVEALKAAYGAGFPVGVRRPLTDDVAGKDYARLIASAGAADREWPDAPDLLRDILAAAVGHSVTVVSIGFFGNLARFLAAGPHAVDLVRRKVARTIVMGGVFPSGREFNFVEDARATSSFLAGWPTPVDFVGYEAGEEVITGRRLADALGREHPVAAAYRAHSGEGEGRPSWDLIAVHLAACPEWPALVWSPPGELRIREEDGENQWAPVPGGRHRHAILAAAPAEVAADLDDVLGTTLDVSEDG